MGSQKNMERDMRNVFKISLMKKGIKLFQELEKKKVEQELRSYQIEELKKYTAAIEEEKLKRSRKSTDFDYEILCKVCKQKICLTSELCKFNQNHIVLSKALPSLIDERPIKKKAKYDGLNKRSKMFCKTCPNDWGMIADYNDVPLHILSLESLVFRNMNTNEETSFRKWNSMPYDVKTITDVDIHTLFRKEQI